MPGYGFGAAKNALLVLGEGDMVRKIERLWSTWNESYDGGNVATASGAVHMRYSEWSRCGVCAPIFVSYFFFLFPYAPGVQPFFAFAACSCIGRDVDR